MKSIASILALVLLMSAAPVPAHAHGTAPPATFYSFIVPVLLIEKLKALAAPKKPEPAEIEKTKEPKPNPDTNSSLASGR